MTTVAPVAAPAALVVGSVLPHCTQNLAVDCVSNPQLGHFIGRPSVRMSPVAVRMLPAR
jgi:hypothetical protein